MKDMRLPSALVAAASVLLWSALKFQHGGLGLLDYGSSLLMMIILAGAIVIGAVLAQSKPAFEGVTTGAAAVAAAAALYRFALLLDAHQKPARLVLPLIVVAACSCAVIAGLSSRRARSPLHSEGLSIGLAVVGGLLLVGIMLPPSSSGQSFADWNGLNTQAPLLTISWLVQLAIIGGAIAIAAQSRSNWGRMVATGALIPVVSAILVGQLDGNGAPYEMYIAGKPHTLALLGGLVVGGVLVVAIVGAKEHVVDEFVFVPPPPGFASVPAATAAPVPGWRPAAPLQMAATGYAGFGARLGAVIVDGLVGLLFVLPGLLLVGTSTFSEGAVVGLVVELAGSVTFVVLYCRKVGRTGQSWGHKAAGISIVDSRSGQTIGAGRAFGRNLARIISGFPCYLGYLWMLWDPMSQTWHDKIVGTIVVRGAPGIGVPGGAPAPVFASVAPGSFAPQAVAAPPGMNPARWASDPFGRFEHRYWNGQKWTDQVSTNGVLALDEPVAAPVRPPPPAPARATPAPDAPAAPQPEVPSIFAPLAAATSIDDMHDGHTIARRDLSTIRGAGSKMSMTLDTGETFVLSAPLVIGRDPIPLTHLPGAGLLPIDDPDRSISKTHCVIGPNQNEVWVEDCASANGTVVVEADGRQIVVKPGSRIVTEPGSTIRFGDRWLRINS